MNEISKIGTSLAWRDNYTAEEKIDAIIEKLNELIEEHNSKC